MNFPSNSYKRWLLVKMYTPLKPMQPQNRRTDIVIRNMTRKNTRRHKVVVISVAEDMEGLCNAQQKESNATNVKD